MQCVGIMRDKKTCNVRLDRCRRRSIGGSEDGSEDRHCVGRFYRSRGKGWLEIGRIDLASKLACRRGINPIRSVENP
jgi:hypothetical protein